MVILRFWICHIQIELFSEAFSGLVLIYKLKDSLIPNVLWSIHDSLWSLIEFLELMAGYSPWLVFMLFSPPHGKYVVLGAQSTLKA